MRLKSNKSKAFGFFLNYLNLMTGLNIIVIEIYKLNHIKYIVCIQLGLNVFLKKKKKIQKFAFSETNQLRC